MGAQRSLALRMSLVRPEPAGRQVASTPGHQRAPAIDGLRGVAAAAVFAYHLTLVIDMDGGMLSPLLAGGGAGVYVFFVISGYVLYRSMILGNLDLRSYAVRRIARIWPAYLLALIGGSVLLGSTLVAQHPVAYLTLTQNYDPALLFRVLGPSWTLTIEVAFYAGLPFIARWLGTDAGRQFRRITFLGAASLVGLIVTIVALSRLPPSPWHLILINLMPFYLWVFAPGMALAALETRGYRMTSRAYLIGGATLLFAGLYIHLPVIDVVTVAGSVLLVGWAASARVRPHMAAVMLIAGALSYPVYLWHSDVLRYMSSMLEDPFGLTIAAIGVTLTLSAVSFVALERPILRLASAKMARSRGVSGPIVEPGGPGGRPLSVPQAP